MGFLLITVVVISYLNVLSTTVFLLFVSLIFFCFVLLSNIFFSQDVFQVVLFHFLLSFLPIENTWKEKKSLCIRALQQMHSTPKVTVMSRDFQKINTLYLKFFSIQDINCTRQITPLV